MVLIKEDNVPPQKWKIARVTNVFPGADGKVRVAEVKLATTDPDGKVRVSQTRRIISKLCPLPVADDEPSNPANNDDGEGREESDNDESDYKGPTPGVLT